MNFHYSDSSEWIWVAKQFVNVVDREEASNPIDTQRNLPLPKMASNCLLSIFLNERQFSLVQPQRYYTC